MMDIHALIIAEKQIEIFLLQYCNQEHYNLLLKKIRKGKKVHEHKQKFSCKIFLDKYCKYYFNVL